MSGADTAADCGTIANVEAEAALLGALMQEPKLIDPVADKLNAADFSEPLHGRIYSTVVSLHGQDKRPTPVTLRPFFDADEAMKEVGGVGYLAQLTGNGAAVVGAKDFAAQVRELAQRRRLSEGLRSVADEAADCAQSVDDLVAKGDDALTAARDAQEAVGEYTAAEALRLVVGAMDEPVVGVRCGLIPAIDFLLGPMRPSHLIIGAGRPGMGKTVTALSYALGAAQRGHGVLFLSLEMSAEQLAERMAADLCLGKGIRYDAIRDRTLTSEQKREVCRALAEIEDLPLAIIDEPGVSIAKLRMLVRRWKRRLAARGHKLELVVVDYLQLMGGDSRNGRFEVVTEISRGLKGIAKAEGLAVLALSQLSRKVEERQDKRPLLSDLRESGQIEQDADAVLFFLRLEYYHLQAEPPPDDPRRPKWEQELRECEGVLELICAKRRNGKAGTRFGTFHADYQAVR